MPSPFKASKDRLMKKGHGKPGSLMNQLHLVKKDIRKARRGEPVEESMEVMKDARRRYKEAIKKEEAEERDAMMREMDPLQVPRERPKSKTVTEA